MRHPLWNSAETHRNFTLWFSFLVHPPFFRSICKEDPGNLNAWANLGYVYDKLGRELDAGECVEKVSQLMGLESGEATQEETRLLAARCLAEQAYVYPHDVELDSEDDLRERLTAALTLYNKALDYGGQLVRKETTHPKAYQWIMLLSYKVMILCPDSNWGKEKLVF